MESELARDFSDGELRPPKGAAIAPLALYTTEFDSSDCPALGEPMPPPPTAEWVTLEVAGGGPPSARLLCFSLQVEQT